MLRHSSHPSVPGRSCLLRHRPCGGNLGHLAAQISHDLVRSRRGVSFLRCRLRRRKFDRRRLSRAGLSRAGLGRAGLGVGIPPGLRRHVWFRRPVRGMCRRRRVGFFPGPRVDTRFRRCLGSLVCHPVLEPRQIARIVWHQKSTGAGAASSASSFGPIPILSWIRFSMSLATSGFSRRNRRAFSLPCPSWSPS